MRIGPELNRHQLIPNPRRLLLTCQDARNLDHLLKALPVIMVSSLSWI